MAGERVSLKRARAMLAESGDVVDQSTLSRYVTKYADSLDPQKDGRETTVVFDTLVKHRSDNQNMGYRGRPQAQKSAPSSAQAKGRADEAAKNIRAQRQTRELELAERIGALTPTKEVRAAASEAISTLRNAFALSLNDSASALASAFNLEPRLVRPYLKEFERRGLDAFARALTENVEPDGA
jgi:hypothetical protein